MSCVKNDLIILSKNENRSCTTATCEVCFLLYGSEEMTRKVFCKGCGALLGKFDSDTKFKCCKCGGENRYNHERNSIVFISKKLLRRETASGVTFGR